MEKYPQLENDKPRSLLIDVCANFIAVIKFVGHQLALSDQNPHEGRLRGSIIPVEYIKIPDAPPMHDDTI